MNELKPNGWSEHSKLVMAELKRLDNNQQKLYDKLIEVEKKIVALEVKSGLWGGVAGCLVTLTVAIIKEVVLKP